MVACDLDPDISGDALGWKLPVWQALLYHRVLPSCSGLIIYITLICFDFALIYQQIADGNPRWASSTTVFCAAPALGALIFSLSSPPSFHREGEGEDATLSSDDCRWGLRQLLNTLIFPISAICRYCHQIFWSIESMCAAWHEDAERCEAALARLRARSTMELYLFLQAFLHAAPHALMQLCILFGMETEPDMETVALQIVSIIASVFKMASTATLYRRFEREKISGKCYPWSEVQDRKSKILQTEKPKTLPTIEEIEEPASSRNSFQRMMSIAESDGQFSAEDVFDYNYMDSDSDLENNMDVTYRKGRDKSFSMLDRLERPFSSDSEYLTPIRPAEKNNETGEDNYKHLSRRRTIIENTAPIRGRRNRNINIVDMSQYTTPPQVEAPRLSALVSRLKSNAEAFAEKVPKRRMRSTDETPATALQILLPIWRPRSFVRGLEPQDGVAALITYMAWFFFFIARLLSLAAFTHFFPVTGVMILLCQYQIMLLLLIVPKASTIRRAFYIFLAFVYLFCLLEFKVRFRHVRVWHAFWFIVVTLQTLILTVVWVMADFDFDSWWQRYVAIIIAMSTIISYSCLVVFFVILKPREKIIYITPNEATK